MSSILDLNKRPDESELSYINRIGNYKQSGLIDKTWSELSELFNKNLREPGESWTESAYRKKYANLQHFREEFGDTTLNDEKAEELIELRRELEKERIKVRDERNEYRKLIRDEARKESYQEQFIRSIEEAAGKHPLEYDAEAHSSEIQGATTLVVPLSDIHCGIQIDNFWNKYDEDILRQMLNYYLTQIETIAKRHSCEDVVVLATELISGQIHNNLRLQNNQDLIDQFLTVTDYVCDFLRVLSLKFNKVLFYVAPGNHGRINPKKEDSLEHENMDNLVIPFVKSRLQLYQNVYCCSNEIDPGIVTLTVEGQKLVFVHGDKDSMNTAKNNMTKLLGYIPDIILLGHRHFCAHTTEGATTIIQSGSMVGTDEYAVSNRLIGQPEQAVFVVSTDGVECLYDVKL